MASILDISVSSDSEDDVDYLPPTNVAVASGSSCDEREVDVCDEEDSGELKSGKKKTKTTNKREALGDKEVEVKSHSSSKVDEKTRAKDLWESFLIDVETVTPKKSASGVCNGNVKTEIQTETFAVTPKVTTKSVPEVFEFAGETVTLDKDLNTCASGAGEKNNSEKPPCIPKKRGIDSVLNTIMNKSKKLSVLEKTAYDWSTFKKDEGLEMDLEKFNKGKQGYLERQRFLERSDLRSFEMEKSMRQTIRKK